jgi:hypothetical protein
VGFLTVVGGLIVARMNAQSALRVARETARREYRQNSVRPCLEFLDRRILLYEELISAGPRLVSALENFVSLRTAELEQARGETQRTQESREPPADLQEALRRLRQIPLELGEFARMFRDTGLVAFLVSDHEVVHKTHRWIDADRAFFEVVVASRGITAAPKQLKLLRECAEEAFKRAVAKDSD